MTTDNIAYGSYNSICTSATLVTNTVADSSDAFTAWQSARVDNIASVKAIDYEVVVQIPVTTGTVANDKAMYVYLVPWMYDGSGWVCGGNFGTATEPTGSEAAASISEPNSMKLAAVMPIVVQSSNAEAFFSVAAVCGGICPDGWSLAIRNNCGINSVATAKVAYRAITYTNA